ncbi:MAG: hypothetical protein KF726_23925 [Anaerolineae bacterium]|nr:hypothetical protein [Anaerolineae bacterium]
MSTPNNSLFMEVVQQHERDWGNEPYPHRPSLTELLAAPIVIMWVEMSAKARENAPSRFRLACYQSPEQIHEELYTALVLDKPTNVPNRKIARVFVKQQPVKIVGVRLLFENEAKKSR